MGWAARSKGIFEERKAKASNERDALYLEAIKIDRQIEELKEREIQIENDTYVKPQRKSANKALIGMIMIVTIMARA